MSDIPKIEIPARMLHVYPVCAKESTRYAMASVMIESTHTDGVAKTVVVATDGRRMLVAEQDAGLFDGELKLFVPASIAASAVKLAVRTRMSDTEPVAVISGGIGQPCAMTVFSQDGEAVFRWESEDGVFPPYRDVVPETTEGGGVGLLGVSAELVAGTLKAMQKIVGDEQPVRVYVPSRTDKPIRFDGTDQVSVTVVGVVMPVKIDEWTEQPVKAEPADDAPQLVPALDKPAAETGEVASADHPFDEAQASSPEPFDDAFAGPPEAVANMAGRMSIHVRRRNGGRYACEYFAQAGTHELYEKMEGHHADKQAAYVHAADTIHAWLKGLTGLNAKGTGHKKDILALLDAADKRPNVTAATGAA